MKASIPFLIGDVARLMRRRFDERARRLGVTRAQWKVLFTLSREEGLNQGALAERIEVEPITLCRMIDRLEEAGLVERRRDPADRRAWRIFLTGKAHPVIADLRALADDLTETALTEIDAADRDRLADTLRAIHANLSTRETTKEARHG